MNQFEAFNALTPDVFQLSGWDIATVTAFLTPAEAEARGVKLHGKLEADAALAVLRLDSGNEAFKPVLLRDCVLCT